MENDQAIVGVHVPGFGIRVLCAEIRELDRTGGVDRLCAQGAVLCRRRLKYNLNIQITREPSAGGVKELRNDFLPAIISHAAE